MFGFKLFKTPQEKLAISIDKLRLKIDTLHPLVLKLKSHNQFAPSESALGNTFVFNSKVMFIKDHDLVELYFLLRTTRDLQSLLTQLGDVYVSKYQEISKELDEMLAAMPK